MIPVNRLTLPDDGQIKVFLCWRYQGSALIEGDSGGLLTSGTHPFLLAFLLSSESRENQKMEQSLPAADAQ